MTYFSEAWRTGRKLADEWNAPDFSPSDGIVLPTLLSYHDALQALLVAYEQLAVHKC
jgi:hypothetical protein